MQRAEFQLPPSARMDAPRLDQLSREVYGVLGIPLDALDLAASLELVDAAVVSGEHFWISTPNVNFLVTSQVEEQFRESLLASDLCLVDGMPIVWVARLLGVPIEQRVSGSDLFYALKFLNRLHARFGVFLFGGTDEVLERVSKLLDAQSSGLTCVGTLNPGFGTIEEISSEQIIETINSSGADILAVFLSAKKAQAWLLQNRDRLRIPVRAQFGATINFEAGTIRRAPLLLRRVGLEWLWRIKEEPYLWRRYWTDGKNLCRLFLTAALPLIAKSLWMRWHGGDAKDVLRTELCEDEQTVLVQLSGRAVEAHISRAIEIFRQALAKEKSIDVDTSNVSTIDPRFLGLLLMVRKQLRERGQNLRLIRTSPALRRKFRWNRFEFLLPDDGGMEDAGRTAPRNWMRGHPIPTVIERD